MKTAADPRHQIRRKLVQDLYTFSFPTKDSQVPDAKVAEILKNVEKIDKFIADAAPEWPINKINKIDLAILRLSVFEFLEKKTPPKVVIDEAVELGKEFGSEASSSFVNGVLGKIING